MGIFDRFRSKAHEMVSPSERGAVAHDEAADAFGDRAERARQQAMQAEEDRRAAADMTAEGDPLD